VAHRIVFGGEDDAPSIVTEELLHRLEDLMQLDPLHIPGSIAVVRRAREMLQDVIHVACFDTAFFHDLPQSARTLPIPTDGDPLLRRFGFHGLSYEYVVHLLAGQLRPRTIVAHLGNGCSLAALLNGRPIDMTMGFSPLSGVIMATRPGDLDPGVLLYLLERRTHDGGGRLRAMLENESGLRALSGGESDLRRLCERRDAPAALAVEMFVFSVSKAIGALAVTLGGLDMLVFSGGIGEHNDQIRSEITARVRFLNLHIDVRVVSTDENAMIARHAALTQEAHTERASCSAVSRTESMRPLTSTCAPKPMPKVQ